MAQHELSWRTALLNLHVVVLLGLGSSIVVAEEPTPPAEVVTAVAALNTAWSDPIDDQDPRFGTARILDWLDLDRPGLEEVKKHAERRDYRQVDKALLAYYRTTWGGRSKPGAELRKEDARHAQDALVHAFRGNGRYPNIYRGGVIDWTNPARHQGVEIGDHEWLLQYHRLTWWTSLGNAFEATKDERYFNEWRFEIASYAKELLPLRKDQPAYLSRGMECASRCDRIREVLPSMIGNAKFDEKLMKYVVSFMAHHAKYLPEAVASAGNHRLYDLKTCFLNGVTFPELKGSAVWIAKAVEGIPPMIDDDVYADGMNRELIFSYHTMYMDIFLECWDLFERYGYGGKITDSFKVKLQKMAEIYAMQSFPDFTICQFGDAWKNRDATWMFTKEKYSKVTAQLPYRTYMATKGQEGTPPKVTNVAYPESGFYFFRTCWGTNSIFMPVKCADVGEWHNQIDNGTFELYAYGRNLMNDSGCYVYGSASPEEQRWRAWFRSTKVHQTLTLDGRDIALNRKHRLWVDMPGLIVAAFDNQSYANLLHRRTMMMVDQKFILIHDQAIGDAEGDVGIHFQFVPAPYEIDGLTATTKFETGANLLVKTFPCGKDIDAQVEDGWISFANGSKEERPAWTWSTSKAATEAKVEFLTVLIPTRDQETVAAAAVQATHRVVGSVHTYQLTVGGKSYVVTVDGETGVCGIE